MINDVEDTLPNTDDMSDADQEQALLDAVLANSPIMEEAGVPLPEEVESDVPDPDDSEEVDDQEAEEAVSEEEEEVEEEEEEEVEEDADEESATQTDVFTADDLDLDAKVVVKVDGEEMEVSFGDLMKGYQTDAHLSMKGRELGEAQKALEAQYADKIGEVDKLAEASAAMLGQAEQGLAKQYHDLEEKINKARADGDTYELGELKDKREQVQQRYWAARQRREGLMEAVTKQREEVQAQQWNEQLEYFHSNINEHIPDFDEKVATDIRDFAVSEGLSEDILATIVDPVAVKMLDDYRRLKQGVTKGAAKRKAVPAKKAVPTKKAKPAAKKKEDAAAMRKARAFKEGASADDQMEFLRDYASKSLNL